MPRTARIAFNQGFYHVFNRGINKTPIFLDPDDYHTFLTRLEALATKLGYDHSIYAYILMPNHFHLLIQTRKTPLAKIMTSLLTSYSMRFNKKHERVGILFQNRFKSKLCDTNSYFSGGSRYILLNAVHAGLASSLESYPYSSYHEMFSTSRYRIIDQTDINRLIGNTVKSKKAYHQFLLDGIKLGDQESEYGFDREIAGPPLFFRRAQKKFIRRTRVLKNASFPERRNKI